MGYKILSGQFDKGTTDQKAAYIQLLGKDHTQYKFDLYFHWYNIVHEYGHCLLDYYNKSIGGVKEEILVNQFAVGYWKRMGYEKELQSLEEMLSGILQGLQSPVPDHMSLVEYYEQIWGTDLLMRVDIYGYLQFKTVLLALENTEDLSTTLKKMGIQKSLEKKDKLCTKYSITAQTAYPVLDNLQLMLDGSGIEHPDVQLELVDDPFIHGSRKI